MVARRLSVVACMLVLAACTFPGSVKPAVKIGLSAPFEGLYRDLGYEVLAGVRLAVRQRNDAGGICGRYLVELVALNDFNEPEEAVWQARELAIDPGVMGALGGWSLATAGAAYPEYGRLHLPFRAPQPGPASTDSQTLRLGGEAARIAAEELGAHRAAVVSAAADEYTAMAREFETAFGAGEEIVARSVPAADQWVPAALAAQPDLVFVAADAPQAAEWIVQLRRAGFQGRILGGPGLGSQILVDMAGGMAEGTLYVSPFPPVPDDPEFIADYQALSGGVSPGPAGAWAYAAARDLLAGIEGAANAGDHAGCLARRPAEVPRADVPGASRAYLYAVKGGQVYQQP